MHILGSHTIVVFICSFECELFKAHLNTFTHILYTANVRNEQTNRMPIISNGYDYELEIMKFMSRVFRNVKILILIY